LIRVASKGAANRVGSVAVVIDHKVGMAAFAIPPALDLGAILFEGGSDYTFRGVPIGPGGGGRNIAFVPKPFAQLIVSASDVFAEGVATSRFIPRQITGIA
jgi:hypothetical protein